jgi:lysophospholipase L1-like esterase
MRATFESWNLALREAIEKFCAAHHDVSVFLFSSFKAFDSLLDDPEPYGLRVEDIRRFNGTVWMDHIHPTSQVHDFIANHIAIFLAGIPARGSYDVAHLDDKV